VGWSSDCDLFEHLKFRGSSEEDVDDVLKDILKTHRSVKRTNGVGEGANFKNNDADNDATTWRGLDGEKDDPKPPS